MDKGRVMVWKEFGVENSFTWETSQFAYTDGDEITAFTEKDYSKMAISFMKTLYQHTKLSLQIEEELCIRKELHESNVSKNMKKECKSKDISKVKIQLNIPLLQSDANSGENDSMDDEFLHVDNFCDTKVYKDNTEVLLNFPWKHYFTQQELDDLFSEVTPKEIPEDKKKIVKCEQSIISKDLTRIGFLRRSHDALNVKSIRIISKKLPEKIRAQFLKSNITQKVPTFTNERLREVSIKPSMYKRRQLISGQIRSELDNLVPLGIQRDISVKRYRPSTNSFKLGQKKHNSFAYNPFTNSMIREHITPINDYN